MVISNGVRFCTCCGGKLDNDSKFCKICGQQVDEIQQIDNQLTERKIVYEGSIHKCPNCGEVLDSFVARCPVCGCEVRNIASVSSVQTLAKKLESIEARQMPMFEQKKSFMQKLIGKDFNNNDEKEDAIKKFNEQKAKEAANVIINFFVPNTKEDIMEFMILASANLNQKVGFRDAVSGFEEFRDGESLNSKNNIVRKAWESKLDQVYKKAELSMGQSSDFYQIKNMYDQQKSEIKKEKFRRIVMFCLPYIVVLFVIGLILNLRITIAIFVTLIVVVITTAILKKKNDRGGTL